MSSADLLNHVQNLLYRTILLVAVCVQWAETEKSELMYKKFVTKQFHSSRSAVLTMSFRGQEEKLLFSKSLHILKCHAEMCENIKLMIIQCCFSHPWLYLIQHLLRFSVWRSPPARDEP